MINESINDNEYCNNLIDKKINNVKGTVVCSRFIDILSDPNNKFLNRNKNAGIEESNYIYTIAGLKVLKHSYYGNQIEILKLNRGSHEPSEEKLFQNILTDLNEGAVMIELGSYWCFYSMWFNKAVKNAKNYCIEPSNIELQVGKDNCSLNNINCDFSQGYVGSNVGLPKEALSYAKKIDLNNFINEKNIDYIDILHSDIQGGEYEMLLSIINLIDTKKIKYLFISTHSNKIHYDCIQLLEEHSYRIISDADYDNETFCYDGIILACHKDNNKFPKLYLGNRKYTKLVNKYSNIGNKIKSLSWVNQNLHWN